MFHLKNIIFYVIDQDLRQPSPENLKYDAYTENHAEPVHRIMYRLKTPQSGYQMGPMS